LLRPVVKIALEPSALLVARPDDTGSRVLHLGKLQPYLDSQARNFDRQACCGENAPEQIWPVEQGGSVQEQRDLLPSMLHARYRAPVVGWDGNGACDAVGVRLGGRQPEEQLGTGVAQRGSKYRSDALGFASPLANFVDKRPHTSQPFVAPSIESPVDRSLSPPPQRSEGRCNCECG
jgi:hypothetical protein